MTYVFNYFVIVFSEEVRASMAAKIGNIQPTRWWVVGMMLTGNKKNITTKQKELYTEAYLQIKENTSIIKPGINIKDLVFGGRLLPKKYEELRYSCKMHGVGLCDEWPLVQYPIDYVCKLSHIPCNNRRVK